MSQEFLIINGTPNDDTLEGGNEKTWIYGRGGNDNIYGRGGNDILYGGEGNDEIYGGNGIDSLRGEEGNDKMYGGNGDDYLYNGLGNDILDGGPDIDRATFSDNDNFSTKRYWIELVKKIVEKIDLANLIKTLLSEIFFLK